MGHFQIPCPKPPDAGTWGKSRAETLRDRPQRQRLELQTSFDTRRNTMRSASSHILAMSLLGFGLISLGLVALVAP